MPGKYSHSVVLADFSNRGVISLPPEQYERYALGLPSRVSASQARLRGTKSAAGDYRTIGQKSPRSHGLSAHRFDSLLQPAQAGNTERLMINDHEPLGKRDESWRSKYTEIVPQTQRQVDQTYLGQNRQVDTRTTNGRPAPGDDRPATDGKQGQKSQARQLQPGQSTIRVTRSDYNLRKRNEVEHPPPVPKITSKQENQVNQSQPKLDRAAVEKLPEPPAYSPPRIEARSLPNDGVSRASSQSTIQRILSKESKDRPSSRLLSRTPSNEVKSSTHSRRESTVPRPEQARKDEQRTSAAAQIWDPQLTPQASGALNEPDLDGFSDQAGPPLSYFDIDKDFVPHGKSSSVDSTLIIQRPESSDRGSATPIASPRASSSKTVDRSTISQQTTSSASQRHRLDSESSTSDTSMLTGVMHNALNKPVPSPRIGQNHESGWRLPEISEDHAFSPSIFEDNEGVPNPAPFSLADLEASIGKISSGRDTNFDNDAASELSAAMPPTISRFKDDEDEFNANMTKLFGQDAANAMVKHSSVGRSSAKKSKGFFSKFRSKGQPPFK